LILLAVPYFSLFHQIVKKLFENSKSNLESEEFARETRELREKKKLISLLVLLFSVIGVFRGQIIYFSNSFQELETQFLIAQIRPSAKCFERKILEHSFAYSVSS